MSVTSAFKNLGHAIAAGSKDFVKFTQELPGLLQKAQVDETAINLVVTAINPQAGQLVDLAWHVLGDVAVAVEKAGAATAATQQTGQLNVPLDLETIAAVKQASDFIKSVLAKKGTPAPAIN